MFGDESGKKGKTASDNKIGSDNTIKNALINFDIDFSGLKDTVVLFFPSMRNEMVLRYRAETIAKISMEAYRLAKDENIKITPIPPKIALPLIEKMSLEHEADMYDKWAKLLIAAGVKSNPIHQQYADILANINNENANFLKEIYEQQSSPNREKEYEEYVNKSIFQQCYDEIKRHTSRPSILGENGYSLPDSFGVFHPLFQFPLILYGTEKRVKTNTPYYENSKTVVTKDTVLVFTKEDNNNLIGLEKLGLIKYQYLFHEPRKDENGKTIYIQKCGVLLTQFGYSFVDCLEHPAK
jgi:hypothetical protein